MKPVEKVTAWLYRVARNRIVDLFRTQRQESLSEPISDDGDAVVLLDLLPSEDAGPDAVYARNLLFETLDEALEELPEEQREVFLAHEFLGRSFKEISEETGTTVNTLLSRKRYAVLHLRRRLREIDETFGSE
jgi:RNA polymerase sigma factor (sigma-70 family)